MTCSSSWVPTITARLFARLSSEGETSNSGSAETNSVAGHQTVTSAGKSRDACAP